MRIAISNMAWDVAEDDAVARLLLRYNVDAIDIAPSKYFPEPAKASDADIEAIRCWWSARGIGVTGMQALLFGTEGLNLFGPPQVQEAMLGHLESVCRIGARLGATRLVFGSPKNRDRRGLSDVEAQQTAVRFFRRLGDIAQSYAVMICLEPNPPRYGANFMTTAEETAGVVERVGHRAIRMQFDTGALLLSGEEPATVLQANAGLIGHIHASEPDLLPLGDGGTDHPKVAAALRSCIPSQVVTIEMLATRSEPHLASIERALGVAIRHYGDRGASHEPQS